MDQITAILSALAEPTRRRAMALLWAGDELCVCELMQKLGATQSRMSRHMSVLKAAGLVVDRRDAQWVRYRRKKNFPAAIATMVKSIVDAMPEKKPSHERTNGMSRHQGASA